MNNILRHKHKHEKKFEPKTNEILFYDGVLNGKNEAVL